MTELNPVNCLIGYLSQCKLPLTNSILKENGGGGGNQKSIKLLLFLPLVLLASHKFCHSQLFIPHSFSVNNTVF